jgi:hypothetical protein
MAEENDVPDLLDLKFLPAWVKETPNENLYAHFAGDEAPAVDQRDRRGPDRRGGERGERGPRPTRGKESGRGPRERARRPAGQRPPEARRPEEPAPPAPAVEVRFVPDARVLENVLAQIKASHLAYSVFSLARMFLEKPERYDVRLKAETAALFQLGENGPIASDQRVLENGAFLNEKDHFYRTEVTQSDPIKGNFTSVARCRLSGVLLGPTNHHAYQPQLRNLYEQRFSRRMSFQDYQRQIEIVTNPEAVERWKEEARQVTTYVTLQEEPPITFHNAADTERHFRQTYLPGLLRHSAELTLDGVVSRRLADRSLGRAIEDAWAQEARSPSKMMQELIGAFRQGGLHIFRHRKAMLFVSPIRARPFSHDSSSVSSTVAAILAALTANPRINRNQLLEKLPDDAAGEPKGGEKRKLALASDLHWLISEGHVIEFNDGSLDLTRTKAPPPRAQAQARSDAPNGIAESLASPNDSKNATEASEAPSAEEHPAEIAREGDAVLEGEAAPPAVAEITPDGAPEVSTPAENAPGAD